MAATGNKLAFGTATVLTNAVASLTSSGTFVGGYESATIDNSSNLYLDYQLWGQYTVGTTPTINTQIRIYIVPCFDGTNWPDVFDGTTSVETVTSEGIRDACLFLAKVINVDATTSDRAYEWSIGSVAQACGGIVPIKFSLFTTHSTVAAFNSTAGNHDTNYRGVYTTSGNP